MKTKTALIIGVLSLLAVLLSVVTYLARYSPVNAGYYGSAVAGVSLSIVMPYLIPVIAIALSLGVACYASMKKQREKSRDKESYISYAQERKMQATAELNRKTVSAEQNIDSDLSTDYRRDTIEVEI